MAQERQHDSMDVARDVTAKLGTYHGFLVAMRWVGLAIIVVLSFLILSFCGAGLGWGIGVTVIELAIGLYLVRDRERPDWTSEFGALFMSTSAEHPHPVEDQAAEERAAAEAAGQRAA